MKNLVFRYLFLCCLCVCIEGILAKDRVISWQAPEGIELNNDFTVQIRSNEKGKWMTIPTYLVKVDEVREATHHVENASMATFDFSGKVEIAVTYNKGKIDSARVRPLSYGIPFTTEDNTIKFVLEKPANLSVEVNGDIFHNLHLFANPIDTFKVDKKNPDLIFFGPGIHRFEGGEFRIPSGKTVYVAGGAVMMGRMLIENAHDVKLLGRGIIDPSVKMGIRIANSRNVQVEGLVATQCATGGSDSVTIRNVKVISYFGWGDGMNVFSSKNVLFDRVFCRNSDDCTTVYGTRLGFEGPSSSITMQNSTLWADVAHPILSGFMEMWRSPRFWRT